jgi:hypothetical protein
LRPHLATLVPACENERVKRNAGGGPVSGKGLIRMRILKFIAAVLLPVLLVLALACPPGRMGLWAQLPPSNPNLAPIVTPSGVPSLAQPAATIGIPTLAVIPTPVATTTAATQRAFNCSCFGSGNGTHWMGQVSATGYFAARQSATSACLSYNELKQPASPFNYATSFSAIAVPTPPLTGANQPANAAAAQVLPGTLNFSSSAQLQECSRCTCD